MRTVSLSFWSVYAGSGLCRMVVPCIVCISLFVSIYEKMTREKKQKKEN